MCFMFEKGSEWRRWELHMHTSGTNKNDNFTGKNLDGKWDNYYKDIQNYIGEESDIEKNIVALAVTDYLSIDNYIKVKKDNKLPKSIQ